MGDSADYSAPIEIAEDIFWVGSIIPDDPFQCHSYFISHEDESVLVDPGSLITFQETIKKISQIAELRNIKYLICHHQDPDITACIRELEELIPRKDKFIVTHWRSKTLLKHYNWKTDFWLINEHNWELTLRGKRERKLRFVFTPYAHFAGAFCTFDLKTRTLFSSDIFGGFTENFSLFAEDKGYFDSVKLFHEHYMPGKDVLNNALLEIESLAPELIAPQHGSIIRKDLVRPMIEMLKELDCGLFIFGGDTDLQRLSKIKAILKGILHNLALDVRLKDALKHIKSLMAHLIDLDELLILAYPPKHEEKKLLLFSTDPRHPFLVISKEDSIKFDQLLNLVSNAKNFSFEKPVEMPVLGYQHKKALIFPLQDRQQQIIGYGIIILKDGIASRERGYGEAFNKFAVLISSALERELSIIAAEQEKERFYKMAIIDPLTGLYNRFYLSTVVEEEFYKAKRYNYPLSVVMVDIDHFKRINDEHGHLVGDFVLKEIGGIVKNAIRKGDIPIRYGGEEILVVLPFSRKKEGYIVAERIKKEVEKKDFEVFGVKVKLTISAGVASLKNEGSLNELIEKADQNLYMAKKRGRNKVV